MRKSNKKAFTIVELVIVIAVVAVLAAVLIPTFSNIVKKANDSKYLQERTNQQIADLAEKLSRADQDSYMTWEDFEATLAEKLAAINKDKDTISTGDITAAVNAALGKLNTTENGLDEDQIKDIIEKSLEGQLTSSQVQAIVNAAIDKIKEQYPTTGDTLDGDKINDIINDALSNLDKETGISKEEMEQAIADAIKEALKDNPDLDEEDIKNIIDNALAGLGNNDLDEDDIKEIINNILNNQTADKHTAIIPCPTCGGCTFADCNVAEHEKCEGHTPVVPGHQHTRCQVDGCGKCTDPDCPDANAKCPGHNNPGGGNTPVVPEHTMCQDCGYCTFVDCTEHTKCPGHNNQGDGTEDDGDKHTHIICGICNKCEAEDCPNDITNKCLGHDETCEHRNIISFAYYNSSGVLDPEYHTLLCNTCHKVLVEKAPHTIVDGKCSTNCGYEKTYTFICSAPNNSHSTYQLTMSEAIALGDCTTGKDTFGHKVNHFDCPYSNTVGSPYYCNGCLTIDRSECKAKHDISAPVNTGSSNDHLITCNTCNESWTEEHTKAGGKCECGYCVHKKGSNPYIPVDNSFHKYECSYCGEEQTAGHTISNTSYTSDAYKHIGTCTDCHATVEIEHSGAAGTKCATCQYQFCGHSEDNFEWKLSADKTKHYQVCNANVTGCKGYKMIVMEAEHTYDNDEDMICNDCSYNRGACEHNDDDMKTDIQCSCGAYLINNWSQVSSWFTGGVSNTEPERNIILIGDVTAAAGTWWNSATIDLNGHTFTINGQIKIYPDVSLEFVDTSTGIKGKIAGSGYFTGYGTNKAFNLTLDGVTVEKTAGNLVVATGNAVITISNSTVKCQGANIITGLNNVNVTLTIESSNFTYDSGKCVVFSGTSNSSASGSITVKSSTANNNAFSRSDMMNINEADGHIKVDITP